MAKVSIAATDQTSLNDLAKVFGTTVDELKKANNFTGDKIKSGQVFEFVTDDVDGVQQRLKQLQIDRKNKYNAAKKRYDEYQAKAKSSRESMERLMAEEEDYGDLSNLHIQWYLSGKKAAGWKNVNDYKKYLEKEHKSWMSTADLAKKGAAAVTVGAAAAPLLSSGAIGSTIKSAPGLAWKGLKFLGGMGLRNAPGMAISHGASEGAEELMDRYTDWDEKTKENVKTGVGVGTFSLGNIAQGLTAKGLNYLAGNTAKEVVKKAVDVALNKNYFTSNLLSSIGSFNGVKGTVGNYLFDTVPAAATEAGLHALENYVEDYIPENVKDSYAYQGAKLVLPFALSREGMESMAKGLKNRANGARSVGDAVEGFVNYNKDRKFTGAAYYGVLEENVNDAKIAAEKAVEFANKMQQEALMDPSKAAAATKALKDAEKAKTKYSNLKKSFESGEIDFNKPNYDYKYNHKGDVEGYVDFERSGKGMTGFDNLTSVREGQDIILGANPTQEDITRALATKVAGGRFGKGQPVSVLRNNIEGANYEIGLNTKFVGADGQLHDLFVQKGNSKNWMVNPKVNERISDVEHSIQGVRNADYHFPQDPNKRTFSNNAGHNTLILADPDSGRVMQFNLDVSGYGSVGSTYKDVMSWLAAIGGGWLDHNGKHLYQTSVTSLNKPIHVSTLPDGKKVFEYVKDEIGSQYEKPFASRASVIQSTLKKKPITKEFQKRLDTYTSPRWGEWDLKTPFRKSTWTNPDTYKAIINPTNYLPLIKPSTYRNLGDKNYWNDNLYLLTALKNNKGVVDANQLDQLRRIAVDKKSRAHLYEQLEKLNNSNEHGFIFPLANKESMGGASKAISLKTENMLKALVGEDKYNSTKDIGSEVMEELYKFSKAHPEAFDNKNPMSDDAVLELIKKYRLNKNAFYNL